MKTSNATRKLERAGFKVRNWPNSEFEADKERMRITWIDQNGKVCSLCLMDLRFGDGNTGTFPRSVKAAIESADLAIQQRKNEAPMIARKRREAQEKLEAATAIATAEKSIAQAKVVGDMFKRIVLQD